MPLQDKYYNQKFKNVFSSLKESLYIIFEAGHWAKRTLKKSITILLLYLYSTPQVGKPGHCERQTTKTNRPLV